MKLIALSGKVGEGSFAIVDDDDFDRVSKYTWHALKRNHTNYIRANINGKTIRLHRFIMNAKDGEMVDHINKNGHDNRKINLRFYTHTENMKHKQSMKGASSTYVGVMKVERVSSYFDHDLKKRVPYLNVKYYAAIRVNGKIKSLGSFDDEIKAAEVRDVAALKYHKDFAHLNFPSNKEMYLRQIEGEIKS